MGAWNMTQLMLVSLAATHDSFLILADDHSRLTYRRWPKSGASKSCVLNAGRRSKGLTTTWNLAWQYAIDNGYSNLIIANNDLLVPDGTIDSLSKALKLIGGRIDSTVSKRGSSYDSTH